MLLSLPDISKGYHLYGQVVDRDAKMILDGGHPK